MKKSLSLIFILVLIVSVFASCNSTKKEEEFHSIVTKTQELLDIVADNIYSYWYDCIYNDKYDDDINWAIYNALADDQKKTDKIETNNEIIKELYSLVRDGELKTEVKAVMQAYNDYYAFVIDVSSSFNSFSADKETLKKELASSLKDLEFEL